MNNGTTQDEGMTQELVVNQVGTPTITELAQDRDRFMVLADRMTKAIKAVDSVLCAAIGTRCNPQDFVRHVGGGKESFYLQATGCRKIRGFFGIYMRDRQVTVTPEDNGHYTYEVYGVAGSAFFDRLMGTDQTGGTQIDVFGSRSSSDPFFSKNNRVPNQNDVKKAALTNFEARAINGLIGTQNLTRADLKKFGMAVDQVPGVEYKTGAEGGGRTDLITEPQRKRLYAIWKDTHVEDKDAQALLRAYGFARSHDVSVDKYQELVGIMQGGPERVKAALTTKASAPTQVEDDGSPEGAFA